MSKEGKYHNALEEYTIQIALNRILGGHQHRYKGVLAHFNTLPKVQLSILDHLDGLVVNQITSTVFKQVFGGLIMDSPNPVSHLRTTMHSEIMSLTP